MSLDSAGEAAIRRLGDQGSGPGEPPKHLFQTGCGPPAAGLDRKSTRLNSSHGSISYAVFFLKKKKNRFVTTIYFVSRLEFINRIITTENNWASKMYNFH